MRNRSWLIGICFLIMIACYDLERVEGYFMNIAEKYIKGISEAYIKTGRTEEWDEFVDTMHGASDEDLQEIKNIYPDCPSSLLALLKFADGTYYRKYGDKTVLLYFLGSDVEKYQYPYYLLSSKEIIKNQHIARGFSDDIEGAYDRVGVDDKITDKTDVIKWLHFSDCMNNGGSSQLFIDFSPSASGKTGQIVRFLHDPDELVVIADSFDSYLEMLIKNDYAFIYEE